MTCKKLVIVVKWVKDVMYTPGGVTSIYTGTGRAIFWGAFFGAGNKFWGIIFCITINFGVLFSKTTIQGKMPSIHPIHNMNDSVTSCINVLMMLMLKGISHTLSNCWISAPIMDPS